MKKTALLFLFLSVSLYCFGNDKDRDSPGYGLKLSAPLFGLTQYSDNGNSPAVSRGEIASWTLLFTGIAMTLGGSLWLFTAEGQSFQQANGLVLNGSFISILGTSLLLTFHR